MQFRAQTPGRCQRQYIKEPKDAPPDWRPDIQHWIDQWVERVDQTSPFSGKASQPQLNIIEAQIDWRLISNSGVDEGIIRPVIGAGGWPLLPGSSLKGLFRRACPPDRLLKWCGSPCGSGDLRPGILRFHGAWPADASWTKHLLDIAHPQQNWQVGFDNGRERHSAFGVVSLYQPKLLIGLSSTDPKLSQTEWDDIIATMKLALRSGIGGRTCVGYGSSGRLRGDVIFQCGLEGQGPAAKLLDRHEEFRPTMFRAAIRGMALRLFGGLTDQSTTLKVVGELFGSLSREEGQHVGLLATAYTDQRVTLGHSGRGNCRQPVYATSGLLQWRLTRSSGSAATDQLLAELLAALHGLTMSLGGFGRGWRRPDHRIFYPGYDKTPIGCHWQWRQPKDLPAWIHVQTAAELAQLLARSRALAHRWLEAKKHRSGDAAPWREVIHPRRTRIWTRTAKGPGDAEVVAWFHRSPAEGQRAADQSDSRDLKHTILAGQMNQVGLIWNRLLPVLDPGQPPRAVVPQPTANPMARPARPGGRRQVETGRQQQQACIDAHQGDYLELVVLHPLPNNASEAAQQQHTRFIALMNRGAAADFSPLVWS
jgi:CRISPR-associated protein Cmr6